mgnify:CR=1 FL=1
MPTACSAARVGCISTISLRPFELCTMRCRAIRTLYLISITRLALKAFQLFVRLHGLDFL